jgi:hypothetical protein
MAKWNDKNRNGVVVESTVQLGRFKLSVHRHIFYEPDQWLASSYGLFESKLLTSTDFEQAKAQAQNVLKQHLEQVLAELNELEVTHG